MNVGREPGHQLWLLGDRAGTQSTDTKPQSSRQPPLLASRSHCRFSSNRCSLVSSDPSSQEDPSPKPQPSCLPCDNGPGLLSCCVSCLEALGAGKRPLFVGGSVGAHSTGGLSSHGEGGKVSSHRTPVAQGMPGGVLSTLLPRPCRFLAHLADDASLGGGSPSLECFLPCRPTRVFQTRLPSPCLNPGSGEPSTGYWGLGLGSPDLALDGLLLPGSQQPPDQGTRTCVLTRVSAQGGPELVQIPRSELGSGASLK